ncbi:hypothetical protein FB004_10859 [Sinorhizobium medicae]|nr:hypothetical protein FB004_10859 [Sinorhizobium medicae]TWA24680.1 hypothetical protein FB006_106238 [Sinorhizobium medicae]TWA43984.1 hypothetical protein FB005_10759 [Sinorhizobium medicae]
MPPDQASDQTGVFEFAYADPHVERLGDQIDTARGQVAFESDPGIVSREYADDRREVKSSEVDRERNPEDSAGLFEHCAELLVRQPCLVHDPLTSFKIELTGLGELYLARRAVQEPQADRLLRVRDIALSTLYAAPFCGAIAMPERSATGLTGVFAPLRSE